MNRPNAFRQRTPAPSRRGLLVAGASSTVALLAACSGTSIGSGTTSAATSTSPAGPTPTQETSPATPELAARFPSTVLPLMPGATLKVSGLEITESGANASLTASVADISAAVLDFYTKSFIDQGFTAQPGDSVDGVPSKTFLRAGGAESATVSVVQNAALATFTLGATLLPAAIK